jgi:hypothetical protein
MANSALFLLASAVDYGFKACAQQLETGAATRRRLIFRRSNKMCEQ